MRLRNRLFFCGGGSSEPADPIGGANFSGAVYFTRDSDMASNDSNIITIALKIYPTSFSSFRQIRDGRVSLNISTGGVLRLITRDTSGTINHNFVAATALSINTLYTILISIDGTTNLLYINGSDDKGTVSTNVDSTIDQNDAVLRYGANTSGGNQFAGDIYYYYEVPGEFFDFSDEAVRDDFSDGVMTNLVDGTELATTPASMLFNGIYNDDYPTNKGNGGAFTEAGVGGLDEPTNPFPH